MRGNLVVVNKLLPFLEKYCNNKVFLEAGANDGIRYSNSLYLEENYGWNGILIEPNKYQYSMCVKNRPNCKNFNKALVSSLYTEKTINGSFGDGAKDNGLVGGVRFDYWEKHNELSHHDKNLIDVEVMTISESINLSGLECPSFVSLDIEGYELEALRGLDVKKHKPDIFLIEILEWDIKEVFNEHVTYMDSIGYFLEDKFINGNDYLFIKK